jgi:hypothetical protein
LSICAMEAPLAIQHCSNESMRYCSTCSCRASLLIGSPGGNRERQLQLQRLTRMDLAPQFEQNFRYPATKPTIAV